MSRTWKAFLFLLVASVIGFFGVRYVVTTFNDDDALARLAFDRMKYELGLLPKVEPEKELYLIGCSWSRTGTMTTKFALEMLGFSVYHGADLERHNHRVENIWVDAWWARENDPSKLDIAVDAILKEGYNATIDWPQSFFCLDLYDKYPNAKVFINVRDVDRWVLSARKLNDATSMFMENKFPFSLFNSGMKNEIEMTFDAMGKVPWHLEYVDSIFPWANFAVKTIYDDKLVREKFLEWVEKVKNHVPEDKLLIYDVKEGWEPWLKFLELDEDQISKLPPFPNDNPGADLVWALKLGILVGKTWPFILMMPFLCLALLIKLIMFLFCTAERKRKKD